MPWRGSALGRAGTGRLCAGQGGATNLRALLCTQQVPSPTVKESLQWHRCAGDRDKIICALEPPLLCSGWEGVGCTCSTFSSHPHKAQLSKCPAPSSLLQEAQWPYPRRHVGKKGHMALGSSKAASAQGEGEGERVGGREEEGENFPSCMSLSKTSRHRDENILWLMCMKAKNMLTVSVISR